MGAPLTPSSENVPLFSHQQPRKGRRQPSPPHCQFLHLSASLLPFLLPSPNTLSIYSVSGSVLGARDMVPPVSSSGGKSQQEPRFQQHLTNHRYPTLGPSVCFLLLPLCPQSHDLISPYPNLLCEARPSSNVASSRQPSLCPHPPENLLRPLITQRQATPEAPGMSSQVLGCLATCQFNGHSKAPSLCWRRLRGDHRKGTRFISPPSTNQHPLHCGGRRGEGQVGCP